MRELDETLVCSAYYVLLREMEMNVVCVEISARVVAFCVFSGQVRRWNVTGLVLREV